MEFSSANDKSAHQKINYINVFRALAIILIVIGHSFISANKFVGPWCDVLLKDGTVLFVFISGFLFQYLSDTFEYKRYLKKKFFNIICPYLFTSLVGFVMLYFYPVQNPFVHMNPWIQIPMFLTTGYFHNVPSWYIPMTCIFFLCAGVLLSAQKKVLFGKSLLLYILIISFLFSLCRIRPGFGRFDGNDLQTYIWALQTIVRLTIYFFPIYIFGMFIAGHTSYIKIFYQRRKLLWVLLCIITLLNVSGIYFEFWGRTFVQKLVLTLLVLGYVEHYDSFFLARKQLNKWINTIASYSFAIFFFA